MPIEMIDVSTWQGKMDFVKALEAGAQGVIMRAGSVDNVTGGCYVDYQFTRNKEETKILYRHRRASYWYMRPNHNPITQADFFADLIRDMEPMRILLLLPDGTVKLLKIRWACDIEVPGLALHVRRFCDRMKYHFPDEDGLLYTNPNTWLYTLTGDKSWGDMYHLWLADWTPPAWQMAPWLEEGHLIWQYAVKNDGRTFGTEASIAIDHNRGYFEWAPDGDTPPVEDWRKVAVDGLSVRYAPVYTPAGDATGTLFAKGMLGRRVRVLGQAENGYVPVLAYAWEKGLIE